MTRDEKRMLTDELIYYAEKVEGLKKYCDVSFTICGGCEKIRYRYWLQKQVNDQIGGIVTKLRNIADSLDNRHTDEDLGITNNGRREKQQ